MRAPPMKFKWNQLNPTAFGGDLQKGKRKTKRPLSTKKPMHVVIKSAGLVFAVRTWRHREALQKASIKYGVKVYGSVFNGNHVHMVVMFSAREHYVAFVRDLTSAFARIVDRVGVFLQRPFTRIVDWGRDFRNMASYLELNRIEATLNVDRATARWLKENAEKNGYTRPPRFI
jgi:REP element-mobilizing transposase RayT